MSDVVFKERGRTRKIRRRFRARCLKCLEELSCPEGIDPWEWGKTQQVVLFLDHHNLTCGGETRIVAGIEKDDIELNCG